MDESKPLVGVSLLLHGDQLDPDQVTIKLGVNASKSRHKGETWRTITNNEVTPKTGFWSLAAKKESMELHDQISSLRQQLSSATCSPLCIPGVENAEISVFIALGNNERGGGDYQCKLTAADIAWIDGLEVPVTFTLTFVPTLKTEYPGTDNG